MNMPVVKKKINEKILELVKEEFGGNAYEIIVGGASLNPEIEQFLKSIHYPITVGYGTTETAPLITFSDWHDFVSGSCGRPVDHMEVKINSEDPTNIPGELLTRGLNVMQGYYKNQEATKAALDKDGWYHSGDLATMSEDGHVFIRGRIKNMLLGSNGQNIYPEEIENKLNSMAMVNESIILQKDDQLVGLVHPDMEEAKLMGFTDDDLINIMEENRQQLNKMLPPFCKISNIRLHGEEFQKTPKKSIKRYLYQDTL
jgi:long-chain acyl-CoA synthetase